MKNRINELILKHGYCYVIVQSVRGSKSREVFKIKFHRMGGNYGFEPLPALCTYDKKNPEPEQKHSEDFANNCFEQWAKWAYSGSHLFCLTENLDLVEARVDTYREAFEEYAALKQQLADLKAKMDEMEIERNNAKLEKLRRG